MHTKFLFLQRKVRGRSHWIQRLSIILLFLMAVSPQIKTQAANLPVQDYRETLLTSSVLDKSLYLPLIATNDPAIPSMVYPPNGAVLDTLIPVFQWKLGTLPPDAFGVMSLETASNQPYWFYSHRWASEHQFEENLEPSTKYYWRVGVQYFNDSIPKWSLTEWSFTTGPGGGVIPPAPSLLLPAENAIVDVPQWILSWVPVNGSQGYYLTLKEKETGGGYFFRTTESQEDLRNTTRQYLKLGHYHYEWFVKARNNYAWGPVSVIRQFETDNWVPNTPATSSKRDFSDPHR